MLTAEQFKKKWGRGLVILDVKHARDSSVPAQVRDFLVEAGLPNEAAPFLSFDLLDGGLRRIYQIWGNTTDYSKEEKSRLYPYLVVGSDGSGNPIAIDTNNRCQVVHLDHDDWFNTITFVNTSIPQFAEFLLLTREMIKRAKSELSDEELDEGVPDIYKEELFQELERIDAEAMEDGNFWKLDISML